jgi:hypothetical protein
LGVTFRSLSIATLLPGSRKLASTSTSKGHRAVNIKGCLAAAVDDSADHFRHIVVCMFGLIVFLQELGLWVKTLPGWFWVGGDDEFDVIFPLGGVAVISFLAKAFLSSCSTAFETQLRREEKAKDALSLIK